MNIKLEYKNNYKIKDKPKHYDELIEIIKNYHFPDKLPDKFEIKYKDQEDYIIIQNEDDFQSCMDYIKDENIKLIKLYLVPVANESKTDLKSEQKQEKSDQTSSQQSLQEHLQNNSFIKNVPAISTIQHHNLTEDINSNFNLQSPIIDIDQTSDFKFKRVNSQIYNNDRPEVEIKKAPNTITYMQNDKIDESPILNRFNIQQNIIKQQQNELYPPDLKNNQQLNKIGNDQPYILRTDQQFIQAQQQQLEKQVNQQNVQSTQTIKPNVQQPQQQQQQQPFSFMENINQQQVQQQAQNNAQLQQSQSLITQIFQDMKFPEQKVGLLSQPFASSTTQSPNQSIVTNNTNEEQKLQQQQTLTKIQQSEPLIQLENTIMNKKLHITCTQCQNSINKDCIYCDGSGFLKVKSKTIKMLYAILKNCLNRLMPYLTEKFGQKLVQSKINQQQLFSQLTQTNITSIFTNYINDEANKNHIFQQTQFSFKCTECQIEVKNAELKYLCLICQPNQEICDNCESSNKHEPSHILIKLKPNLTQEQLKGNPNFCNNNILGQQQNQVLLLSSSGINQNFQNQQNFNPNLKQSLTRKITQSNIQSITNSTCNFSSNQNMTTSRIYSNNSISQDVMLRQPNSKCNNNKEIVQKNRESNAQNQSNNQMSQSTYSSLFNSQQLGQPLYKAKYIPNIHFTINEYEPDTNVFQIIELENSGNLRWPDSVALRCVQGIYEQAMEQVTPTDSKKTASIMVQLHSPSQEGLYKTEWRLCYKSEEEEDLKYFGPRISIDLQVQGKKKQSNFVAKTSKNILLKLRQFYKKVHKPKQ